MAKRNVICYVALKLSFDNQAKALFDHTDASEMTLIGQLWSLVDIQKSFSFLGTEGFAVT